MTTKIINFLSIIIAIAIMVGCNLSDGDIDDEIEITEKTATLIEAENKFGLELFQRIYESETEHENIMVSPLSVNLALAMTYNGANGETKSAMEDALKVNGLTKEDINQSYKDLVSAMKKIDPKVMLDIANAIFYRDNFNVEKDFITINKHYYDAEVTPLDFNSGNSLETINEWVYENTNHKIETILDRIEPDHVMFLLNAIYFKGTWQKEFNDENTEELPFYLENGNTMQTETMQRLDTLPYMSNDFFSAVELQYGKGNYYMYVFLPQPGKKVQKIINELNDENWKTWMAGFKETNSVDIKLPRFKYKYEIKLNDVLSEMGMGIAFSSNADFTGINRLGGLFIDFVKHKSFIEVNEEGTEATAATIVAIGYTSIGDEPQKVIFHVDRPFLYAITEKSTGAILFIGTVKNPEVS